MIGREKKETKNLNIMAQQQDLNQQPDKAWLEFLSKQRQLKQQSQQQPQPQQQQLVGQNVGPVQLQPSKPMDIVRTDEYKERFLNEMKINAQATSLGQVPDSDQGGNAQQTLEDGWSWANSIYESVQALVPYVFGLALGAAGVIGWMWRDSKTNNSLIEAPKPNIAPVQSTPTQPEPEQEYRPPFAGRENDQDLDPMHRVPWRQR